MRQSWLATVPVGIAAIAVGALIATPATAAPPDGTVAPAVYTDTAAPIAGTIPANVCAVTFDVIGGQGGGVGDTLGGLGGEVTATVPVAPGESYRVSIGSAGGDGAAWASDSDEPRGNGAGGISGGVPSGGRAVSGTDLLAGGGGGASSVTVGTATSPTIIAAGGGGAGAGVTSGPGTSVTAAGGNGGAVGQNGQSATSEAGTAGGGGGATTRAPGAGGAAVPVPQVSLGIGGGNGIGAVGGYGASIELDSAGGGGGGRFGGGGGGTLYDAFISAGGVGGGGGGGSNLAPQDAKLNASASAHTGDGQVTATFHTCIDVSTTSLPGGAVGTPYSATLTATGGVPPYIWTIASGALPPGLSLSPAGEIAGTPTSSGSWSFTVSVADSSDPSTVSLTMAVDPAATAAAAPTLPATGADSRPPLIAGALTTVLGVALLLIRRRSNRTPRRQS